MVPPAPEPEPEPEPEATLARLVLLESGARDERVLRFPLARVGCWGVSEDSGNRDGAKGVESAAGGISVMSDVGAAESSAGAEGVTAPPGDAGELRLSLVLRWADQRPCMDRLSALEPWLLLRKWVLSLRLLKVLTDPSISSSSTIATSKKFVFGFELSIKHLSLVDAGGLGQWAISDTFRWHVYATTFISKVRHSSLKMFRIRQLNMMLSVLSFKPSLPTVLPTSCPKGTFLQYDARTKNLFPQYPVPG